MATKDPILELFPVDPGYSWNDALDFFRVPHYSNEHPFDGSDPTVFHFKIVKLDLEDEFATVVLWANRDEPSEVEVRLVSQYLRDGDEFEEGGIDAGS